MEETEIEEMVYKAIMTGTKLGEAKFDLAVAVEMGRRTKRTGTMSAVLTIVFLF